MRPTTRPPRAWAVADEIRADILAGRLEPGSRLGFSELSESHQVSVGVLREALIRLVDRGIVRAESNIGFKVMSLSRGDLRDLTTVRVLTEPAFARYSVLNGSVEWEAELVAAHHRLTRAPLGESDDYVSEEWATAHAAFHLALVAGVNSDRMLGVVGRLRDEADLYRRWYSLNEGVGASLAQAAEEHREIVVAATGRDADRTEVLLREHIQGAADSMLRAEATAPAASTGS